MHISYNRHYIWIVGGFALAVCTVVGALFADVYVHATGFTQISSGRTVTPSLLALPFEQKPQFDMESDDSLQRFLDTNHPFHQLTYVPVDLTPINSNFTANDARKFKLRQEAGDQFADMAWHFWNTFSGDRLAIFSAYRSKSYQDSLLRNGCNKDLCAKGGTSEHQAGLALDLRVVTKGGRSISLEKPSKYSDWLHAHAQEWGFHNTYQKGIAIDGKIVEAWHWRYMGKEMATLLWENGQTIAEYYKECRM